MSIYISVVSHGHGDLIQKLSCLSGLSEFFTVVVKLNKSEKELIQYLKNNSIKYIDEQSLYGLGFGHNNNIVFNYCQNELLMSKSDYFLVFNPDVISDCITIQRLIDMMKESNVKMAGVNLFKDSSYTIPDNSVRHFPTLIQFAKSFLKIDRSAIIDKSLITKEKKVDWIAGSFLAFESSHYSKLQGFDENYFMYCEDIDICYRSQLQGEGVTFFPQIKMQHLAKHANRRVFSKHFYWHVFSVIRFLYIKQKLNLFK